MKTYVTAAVLCGCLLIGSLYPRLLVERHIKLVDSRGQVIEVEGDYQKELPVKLESGLWKFFQTLK